MVIQRTFRQLRNGRFPPNLVTKRTSVSRCGIRKTFSKIFTLGVIFPQNLKSKIGQTGTSLRAGYRSRDALHRDTACLLRTEDVHLHTPTLRIETHFLLTLETVVLLFHLLSTTSKPFSSLSTRLAHAARLGFFYKKRAM